MKNVDLYSLYVSRPVRLLVYLFGVFIIFSTYKLINAVNEHTHRIEADIKKVQSIQDALHNDSIAV